MSSLRIYWPWLIPAGIYLLCLILPRAFPSWAARQIKSANTAPQRKNQTAGWGVIFIAMGLAFVISMLILPSFRAIRAQRWPHVTGTIVSRELVEKRGTDATVYRVDIRYTYKVADHTYSGNRYDPTLGASSTHDRKAAIVSLYQPQQHVAVYYDPAHPDQAVLSTAVPPEAYEFGWMPLIFVVIGIFFFDGPQRWWRRFLLRLGYR